MQQQVLIKTKAMQLLQRERGRPLEEEIFDLYVSQGLTLAEVAGELGVGISTLSRWLTQLGIEARPPGNRPRTAA